MGICEHDFWHLPLASVQLIAENKTAYETWKYHEEERRVKNGKQ